MPQLDEVALASLLRQIPEQESKVDRLRRDRGSARLHEMAMQSHVPPLERHALAERVRACDDAVAAAVVELGKLEQSLAKQFENIATDMKTNQQISATIANARLSVAARSARPAPVVEPMSSGLAAVARAAAPHWNRDGR
jgi:hypothetical protein